MTGLKATALVVAATLGTPVLGQVVQLDVSLPGVAAIVCGLVVALIAWLVKRDLARQEKADAEFREAVNAALAEMKASIAKNHDECRDRHHAGANRASSLELRLALLERNPTAAPPATAEKKHVR